MKSAKYLYASLIVIFLVIIGWSTYYTLGGFDPLEVFVIEGKERTVIGKEYFEKYDAETFHQRMLENRAAIDSGRLTGMFTVIFFDEKNGNTDSLHYFLGAAVDEVNDIIRLPAGYDYREFTTDKIFKVFLSQHWLVRPLPVEVREAAEIKAIQEGESLAPYWFEMYYEDESLTVEHWAR